MSARRRALGKSVGRDPDREPPPAPPPSPPAGMSTRREFLEEELAIAYQGRDASNPGTQAFAAMCRQIRSLREELDQMAESEDPTRGLTSVGILSLCQEYARLLPEPVLAVFANEWAGRHRAMWVPSDDAA